MTAKIYFLAKCHHFLDIFFFVFCLISTVYLILQKQYSINKNMRTTHTIDTFIIILNKGRNVTEHPRICVALDAFAIYFPRLQWKRQDRDRDILRLHISLKFAISYINFKFNIASFFSKKQQNTRERKRERKCSSLIV